MLALTHHFIVQCAAWTSGHTPLTKEFKAYAILGDDIVIYNSIVAKAYHRLITKLGVECNLSKSIMSPMGLGLEFAKRTFFKGSDVTPTPLKELHAALSSPTAIVEYARKYNLTIPQMIKVAGFGYKVVGSSNRPFDKITNVKVRYIIFSDFIQNPSLFLLALKVKALGIKPANFVRVLQAFIIDYSQKTLIKYNLAMRELQWFKDPHHWIRTCKSSVLDDLLFST